MKIKWYYKNEILHENGGVGVISECLKHPDTKKHASQLQ